MTKSEGEEEESERNHWTASWWDSPPSGGHAGQLVEMHFEGQLSRGPREGI